MEINKNLNKLASLLLAKSIKDLYPNAILGDFKINEDGFAYGINFNGEAFGASQFNKVKKQMQKNIDRAYKIEYESISKEAAKQMFAGNKYKLELIDDANGNINICKFGNDFVDICENLSIDKLSTIKAIELNNVSGYYWKGSSNNDQLIMVHGMAFDSQSSLEQFKKELQDRSERDHRKIGKDLELFTFDEIVGQGLPIWLPNGQSIKSEVENYILNLLRQYGFQIVSTPVLGSKKLYETSGHWFHYRENMFTPVEVDNETLVLRPMTCPHHLTCYKYRPRSYRELPFRIGEFAFLHRYEASGGLIGLERVRQLQLVDTHILCTPSQMKSEIKNCYKIIKEVYKTFGLTVHSVDLSLHDPKNTEKFFDNPKMWAHAEKQLRGVLKSMKIPYKEMVGEAAFYGPKIDFQFKTVLGKIITVSTIQLDFLLPERFKLEYKDSDGQVKTPIMIHLGSLGTLERFVSVLLEQTKGILPLWLSPIQVEEILVDNEKHAKYAERVANLLRKNGIRVHIDNSDERLSKKIFNAQTHKTPYQIVIGDNEVANKTISFREYGKTESTTIKPSQFVTLLKKRIKSKK